jgi:hypothetical protein
MNYIISEEQLSDLEDYRDSAYTEQILVIGSLVRDMPLEQELRSFGEKILDDLCNLFRWTNKEANFRPWNIGHIEDVLRAYREKYRVKPE